MARALRLSGYSVELAADRKRALKLASEQKVAAAIIAPGSCLAGLATARELRDTVPKLLVLAEKSEMARLGRSLPEADAFLLKSSSDEELIGRLAETVAGAGRAGDDASTL